MKTLLLAVSLTAGLAALPAFAQSEAPGAHFMEQWDMDGDGQVTLPEARAKRAEVFVMFDTDEDGTLNPAEWQGVAEHLAAEEAQGGALNQMGQGGGQGKGQGQGMGHNQGNGGGHQGQGRPQQAGPGAAIHDAMTPAFNDTNGDGIVTADEFTGATDRLFPLVDRTSDGVISLADFGRP
jgi:hypothetical protein